MTPLVFSDRNNSEDRIMETSAPWNKRNVIVSVQKFRLGIQRHTHCSDSYLKCGTGCNEGTDQSCHHRVAQGEVKQWRCEVMKLLWNRRKHRNFKNKPRGFFSNKDFLSLIVKLNLSIIMFVVSVNHCWQLLLTFLWRFLKAKIWFCPVLLMQVWSYW